MKRQHIYIKQDSDLDKALEIAQYIDAWAKLDAPSANNRVITVSEYHKVVYMLAINGIHFSSFQ